MWESERMWQKNLFLWIKRDRLSDHKSKRKCQEIDCACTALYVHYKKKTVLKMNPLKREMHWDGLRWRLLLSLKNRKWNFKFNNHIHLPILQLFNQRTSLIMKPCVIQSICHHIVSHMNKSPLYFFSFSANILFYVGLVSNCSLIRSGESQRCFDAHERERQLSCSVGVDWTIERQLLVQLLSWQLRLSLTHAASQCLPHQSFLWPLRWPGRIKSGCAFMHRVLLFCWPECLLRCFYWETLTATWTKGIVLKPKKIVVIHRS